MSTLFLTNQNTQAVSTEKHLVELWLVTWQPTRHFLASPIALRNIKCHNTQNTNIIIQLLITTQKKPKMPTLLFCGVPPLLKCAKKEEKTRNFCTFPVTNYFYFHNTYLLLPSRMPLPLFNFGSSPPGRLGGTSTTSGDDSTTTNSSSLQKQETIS